MNEIYPDRVCGVVLGIMDTDNTKLEQRQSQQTRERVGEFKSFRQVMYDHRCEVDENQ